ncbi:MAG TPA: type 4a pilus biogenesis protein PilO [Burkholderiales bacterium]|nr:type 4a pilus biogenesis protein PilO [Burkholderiales bacterium]
MTLDELRRLDPKKVGSWPVLPKLTLLLVLLLLMIGAAYYFVWSDQLTQIDSERAKTDQLKITFVDKKKIAVNLPAYRKQLDDIEKQFGALLRQLPGKSEMDALLTDINQAGLGRGLQFELFKPAASETVKDFYAELPITIRVTGNYHDIGAFAGDIGKLSRIVTLNDISVGAAKDTLSMDATAMTFRYLDEAEVAEKRRAAAAASAKKGAPPKK